MIIKTKNDCFPWVPFILAVIIMISFPIFIGIKCYNHEKEIASQRKFKVGDIVVTKIGRHKGMIILYWSNDLRYDVRFDNSNQVTAVANASVIGGSENSSMLPVITMYQDELEKSE